MKKRQLVIHYNAPVVLSFSMIALIVLGLDFLTGGATTMKYFCVYRSSFSDPLTYLRLFTHVLGHADYAHYISNIMLMLVIGTTLEDKYGSKKLMFCILVTALVSGLTIGGKALSKTFAMKQSKRVVYLVGRFLHLFRRRR